MKEFTVCGIQIAVKPNDIEYNVRKIKEWAIKAKKVCNPELMVFPETVTTGFSPNMAIADFYEMIDRIPGKVTDEMIKLSREVQSYLVIPMYEKGDQTNVIYNSAVVIGPKEGIIGVYRKTHLFPTERLMAGGWSTPGDEATVFELPFCKLGIMICYDGDFPELARELVIKGAEVIVRPSALLRSYEVWELTNKARAYDNHVYVVGVNAVGADAGNNYYFGNSMIISPIAQKLAQARGTEEIIYAKLDPEPLKYLSYGADSPMIFDHVEDRNLGVYKNILNKARCPFEPSKRIPY